MNKSISTLVCLIAVVFALFTFSGKAQAASAGSTAGRVATASGNLNVRKTSSPSSSVITSLKKGTYLTVISKSGTRWKVEYAPGKYGYCHSSYIKSVSGSKAMYVNVSSSLNVRSSASTNAKIKTTLPRSSVVVVLSRSGSFSRIVYDGVKTGYVASKYLSETKPASNYKAVKLSVPSYKQNDTRWSSIKLGTQGDTIGSSGCTTVSLAMTESFRLNKTVTPAKMSSSLTYSSSGSLYWPQNYETVLLSNSSYLSKIYSVLKTGKPVIVGAKKSNGSQHWVVVTGFSGTSLKASAFTINDPGSSSRKTLADFVAVYPVLYKAAWYK